ncbi:hypothetical protein [Candidatus Endomicrobiellum devescovinae]|uniref:hypothetical protein n=1 Tax=Candidatus Endomicrobiellum devescovinae TaxID=3242322 RepID=UPI002839F4B6|nr:hypothetical protein [Endomicrobium sp.]MDR1244619.1 hypothetical protein [Endomicrobium sp.]MDR1434682.1 hypothetical protein [Endomicrobium sp.]MDR2427486.1 hypothetical protein [Endomicrobium sp.]MDR2644997.1 hypothetical protein [Endomicrobium sp.]
MANILILSVEKRNSCAVKIQETLTSSGCQIRTRLGIHDSSSDSCSDKGLIILEIVSEEKLIKPLLAKFETLDGVKAKFVTI